VTVGRGVSVSAARAELHNAANRHSIEWREFGVQKNFGKSRPASMGIYLDDPAT